MLAPHGPFAARSGLELAALRMEANDARGALVPLLAVGDSLADDRLAPLARQRAGDAYTALGDDTHALGAVRGVSHPVSARLERRRSPPPLEKLRGTTPVSGRHGEPCQVNGRANIHRGGFEPARACADSGARCSVALVMSCSPCSRSGWRCCCPARAAAVRVFRGLAVCRRQPVPDRPERQSAGWTAQANAKPRSYAEVIELWPMLFAAALLLLPPWRTPSC